MAVWGHIPIEECGEFLVPIPAADFTFYDPHPYVAQGAVYDSGQSPFMLRQGVVSALVRAQEQLHAQRSGYRLKVFDALRPVSVQAQMVELSLSDFARRDGLDPARLTVPQRDRLSEEVGKYWAAPVMDPSCPPPHSTGGAIDLTIIDTAGCELDMGVAIDELTPECATDFFNFSASKTRALYHANRMLLKDVMEKAGFKNNPNEWWHFDLGDQRWAYEMRRQGDNPAAIARYGRADLVPA